MVLIDARPLYRRLPEIAFCWMRWQLRRLPLRLRAAGHQAVRGRMKAVGPIGGRMRLMP